MRDKLVPFSDKISTIYFDLDGPLIDVSGRYFEVYRGICKELGLKAINKQLYWRRKRCRKHLLSILGLKDGDCRIEKFKSKWLRKIELKSRLRFDRIFPFTEKVLRELAKKYCLILVTLRRNQLSAQSEIKRFHLNEFFKKIIVVSEEKLQPQDLKYKAISSLKNFNSKDIIVGDTEVDIVAAKKLGIRSVAVLSGIRNRQSLEYYQPDYIIRDVRDLISKLKL